MKKKYFFALIKNYGNNKNVGGVHLFMYRLNKNGKFYLTHRLETKCMFSYWSAIWYLLRFNLPKFFSKNGNMFGYKTTTGTVKLFKIPN